MQTEKLEISLAAARVNAGMTQKEIAKILHVTPNTICAWERGDTTPSVTQARELSRVYKMPLKFIFIPEKSNKI